MKFLTIFFIFIAFTLAKILILNEGNTEPIVFPSFDAPDFDFIDLSGGCGGFTDCIEYVGAVLYNIGLTIIFLVLFIVELVTYVFELFALLLQVTFTGIDGAPFWINILLATPFAAAVALIIFRMSGGGEAESD